VAVDNLCTFNFTYELEMELEPDLGRASVGKRLQAGRACAVQITLKPCLIWIRL
jgi:hypothetical protein